MAYTYSKLSFANRQSPPVVAELQAIFAEIPSEELLRRLEDSRRRGPRKHALKVLWQCYVAYYALGLESVSALIRLLQDNPYIAEACGISPDASIPSQPTFSRFFAKIANERYFAIAVHDIFRNLTRRLFATHPDFGKSVAIDSTDIKAWSNGSKKGTWPKSRIRRQTPRIDQHSDPDAGWCVKTNTEGNKKFVWGYKVHVLVDTTYELPVAVDVSRGNLHDVNVAAPLLGKARYINTRFLPQYVIGDSAYSSNDLRRLIKRQYRAEPIIDPNPGHKRAFAKTEKTPAWQLIYNRRTVAERLNARLKLHHKLNHVRVRGRAKVGLHVILSVIALQAKALATGTRASVRKVA